MRILISNDDGIQADGIRALARVMTTFGEVTVVAPDGQRSASSHGISMYRRLYANPVDMEIPGVRGISLSGTPVDCVKWAVYQQAKEGPFDLMVSGINQGQNLATDVLYSGTVAAAGEAALLQIPSIAFSLVGPPFPFDAAAKVAGRICEKVIENGLPADTFLNVNFPDHDILEAPWQLSVVGARTYTVEFRETVDDSGKACYRYAGDELEESGGDDTDVRTIQRGCISITPLRYRFTNEGALGRLKAWLHEQ